MLPNSFSSSHDMTRALTNKEDDDMTRALTNKEDDDMTRALTNKEDDAALLNTRWGDGVVDESRVVVVDPHKVLYWDVPRSRVVEREICLESRDELSPCVPLCVCGRAEVARAVIVLCAQGSQKSQIDQSRRRTRR